jgi:3-(3-hydroxy-phenyl)propionate hydroxylase
MLSLDFAGEVFEDRFLIADVRMAADFPTERWFWFDPPFHPGQSALLHKQPDGIWRIDLQLGREADIEREKDPELVTARVARMLGHRDFTLEWVSIYRFQCRRLERFVHDRVIFAGDSAHQVSPFGARGANSGIQDADNLGWKLARILDGTAPATLLDSYDRERSEAADENILNSTRSTDFIAPHSAAERRLRDAVLDLAPHAGFAQRMVNSGRLSLPTAYSGSQLSTADSDAWHGGVPPGAPLVDCPLRTRRGDGVFLHDVYDRQRFTVVAMQNGGSLNPPAGAALVSIGPEGAFDDETGLFARRYAATPGSAYLLRPDGHVAARFKSANSELLEVALRRAGGGRA